MKSASGRGRFRLAVLVSGLALGGVSAVGCSDESFSPSSAGGSAGAEAGLGGQAGGSGAGGTAAAAGSSGSGGTAGGTAGADSGAGGTAGTSGSGGVAGAAGDAGVGTLPNGASCTSGGNCLSGKCVDDVCCNTACDGVCEGCAVAGKLGSCTAYPDKDPDKDCVGGAAADSACAGACNGSGACQYPAPASCGASTCAGATQSTPTCDGAGACKAVTKPCAPYVCGATACKTVCAADPDCVTGYFCNTTSKKCEAKRDNGNSCSAPSWCKSNFCAGGTCCNTACTGANFSCSTGTCNCNGKVCGGSEACVDWYRDSDTDSYGDPGNKTLGCSTSGPAASGYVSNSQDCYDQNSAAKPGQTQYFTVGREGSPTGNYDYNCDNAQSTQYPNLGSASCAMCGTAFPKPGYNLGCSPSPCSPLCVTSGFRGAVFCGQAATLYQCTTLTETTTLGTQGCR